MATEFVVSPGALLAVAASLRGTGEAAGGAAGLVRSAAGLNEPSMAGGVDAVVSAWGGVAELLAASTGVLGELVGRAAAGYVATDEGVESGFDAVPA